MDSNNEHGIRAELQRLPSLPSQTPTAREVAMILFRLPDPGGPARTKVRIPDLGLAAARWLSHIWGARSVISRQLRSFP